MLATMAMLSKPKEFSMTQQIGNCNLPPFITSQHTQPHKTIKQKIFKAISEDTLLLLLLLLPLANYKRKPIFPKISISPPAKTICILSRSPSSLLQREFPFPSTFPLPAPPLLSLPAFEVLPRWIKNQNPRTLFVKP